MENVFSNLLPSNFRLRLQVEGRVAGQRKEIHHHFPLQEREKPDLREMVVCSRRNAGDYVDHSKREVRANGLCVQQEWHLFSLPDGP